jgi:ketosteroid isomerase-like protein
MVLRQPLNADRLGPQHVRLVEVPSMDEQTTGPSTNVELVRSIYADWERGDFDSADWAHPEIEYVIADGPSPGTWTGLAGMAMGFRDIASPWVEYRVEADGFRELDAKRVLVPTHFSGRGKTSGLELGHMRAEGASVWHLRDGRVTRLVVFWDRERALADLGLSPEADSPAR